MIPSALNSDYPKFVANQVLTSDNLNDLFGYLDEQDRLTRTNLVGIGIVCGLQVKTGSDTDGKFITITKGCGVTSQGYLVAVPEISYHFYNHFDAVKCQYYDKFVDIDAKTQKFPLWELKQLGESEDPENPFHKLDEPGNFLNDKVVLIFVELLETNNKNCDPNSCDDKGTLVNVTFRPLLATKLDVEKYLANGSNQPGMGNALQLPDMRMPRYDVASTLLLDSEDVFQAYQNILTPSFISALRVALSGSWTKLGSLLTDDYPSDPFTTLEAQFAFLNDGTIQETQVLNLQYFYDFFSDLYQAYDELRRKAYDVVCECLPDENLFPRHLLLGEAVGFDELKSLYRTRFISSPVLCCCAEETDAIRSLFRRLVLMFENLSLLDVENKAFKRKQVPIRITPSSVGKDPLSEKAIPFYYDVKKGSNPLYLSWNPERTTKGIAHQILSYKSSAYNNTDDFVMNPLEYDLEPYNFLRIEGHVGLDYRVVLKEIEKQKLSNRLPFDVIALSSDTRGIFNITDAITSMDTTGSIAAGLEIIVKHPACFADIFLAFDQWFNKLRCCLLESKTYFAQLPSTRATASFKRGAAAGTDAETDFTIGQDYEEMLKTGTISDKFCSDLFVEIASNKSHYSRSLVMMPYKIDGMIAVLPDHISKLDAKALETNYTDLTTTSSQLNTMIAARIVNDPIPGVDAMQLGSRLQMSCLTCLFLELRLLIREFLIRLLALLIKQKLGFYAYTNPGIQHKAGVPMGGTFILVYHEQSESRDPEFRGRLTAALKNVNTRSGAKANSFYSGEQPLLSSIMLIDELLFLLKVNEVDEEPNEMLDGIVESIQTGTVIADFYVPYLCCSDCPPSQMVFMPSKEQEPENRPPVANAGPDVDVIFSPNAIITLAGSGSDPDGDPITFSWTQESGPNNASINSPDQPVTTISGFVEGTYIFKLTVKDDKGATGEDEVTVNVKVETPPSKTCGPLTEIIDEFLEWDILLKDKPTFKRIFKSYKEVKEFFNALTGILNETMENQIQFFALGFNGEPIQQVLVRWLSQLHDIIMEDKEHRLLALMLYRILNKLSMYIVCIQPEDFNQAKVQMGDVFKMIDNHVRQWVDLIKQGVFSDNEVAVVKNIGEDIRSELKRIDENGETAAKSQYVLMLGLILSVIESVT